MSLTIRVNGINYTNFETARVARSMETLVGAFTFTSSVNLDKQSAIPLKQGDEVQILADDILVQTCYIEEFALDVDPGQHLFTVNGRGILSDFIDSSVQSEKEFVGSVSLKTIARSLLDALGFTKVSVVNQAGTIEPFSADDITSANTAQSNFDFLESFARKRQIYLTDDQYGNLVFTRGTGTKRLSSPLLNKRRSNDNNIKSSSLSINYRDRYNRYLIKSQLNPTFLPSSATPDLASDQSGEAKDSKIRTTRVLEINAEESTDSTTAGDRAKWEANIRRANSFAYNASVQGFTVDGDIWKPNTLVKVVDDYCSVNSYLLLKSVEFVYDLQSGSVSNLLFVPPDAYKLQAEQNQREASSSDLGEDFS